MAIGDARDTGFEEWYLESRDALVGAAFLYTASWDEARDLTQETFARAWQHWDKVRVHDNRDAWTRTVLHNLAVSRWRRRRFERTHPPLAGRAADPPSADHLDLARSVARLPPKLRRAIILHDLLDLSVEDVATEMAVPTGTVRSWLHRARMILITQLEQVTRSADGV